MKSLFVPRTVEFVKKRAAEIQRANPLLTRVRALETASTALGYSSWFDAQSRINARTLTPSSLDEDVDLETRLWRRYLQGCALVDLGGFAPCEADTFVRLWNPTGRTQDFQPENYESVFSRALHDVRACSAQRQTSRFDEGSIRLNEHLIRWQVEDDGYFVVSNDILAKLPPYVRGDSSAWLDFEDGLGLAWLFPEWFGRDALQRADEFFKSNRPRAYQWHYGGVGPDLHDSRTLPDLQAEAAAHPLEMFPLSYRFPRLIDGDGLSMSMPMVSGAVFEKFLADRGALRLRDVRWFNVDDRKAMAELISDQQLKGQVGPTPFSLTTLKSIASESRPGWLSPFKHGPFFEYEYNIGTEGGRLMLHEELDPDDLDDDDLDDSNVSPDDDLPPRDPEGNPYATKLALH